jgi:tetratricopeptide (TPR) repeat protein
LGALAQRSGKTTVAHGFWSAAFGFGVQTTAVSYNLGLVHVLHAEAALNDGDFVLSLQETEAGLQLLPGHKRLLELQGFLRLRAGYQLAEQGKWKQALEIWKPVDSLMGANGRYLAANRALAYEKMDMYKDAAEAWREFARRRPRKGGSDDALSEAQVARLWSRVSTLYMKAGLVDEAIESLQTALKYQPDDLQLGLALTHRYLEAERDEAAANQMDRLYKLHPKNIEVLVLRAEMAEMGIQGRGFWRIDPFMSGISQWEAVYATNDETYAPVAREQLENLYLEIIGELEYMGRNTQIQAVYNHAFKTLPDYHFLRALYVVDLLKIRKRRKEAIEQIALIDLTNDEALHQLVDGWHIVNEPDQAKALLEKAETLKPHDSDFYLGIANCAMEREQLEIMEMYQQEAFKRAIGVKERQNVQISIAMSFTTRDPNKAIMLLKDVVKADKNCAPALISLVIAYMKMGKLSAAKQSLHDAERAARVSNDPSVTDAVEQVKRILNSPFAGFAGMMGKPGKLPALPPGMPNDDWEDDIDMSEGFFGNIQDNLNNPPNNPPISDRRRRRLEKQNPLDKKE